MDEHGKENRSDRDLRRLSKGPISFNKERNGINRGLLGSVTLAVAVALLFLAAASPSFLSAAALKNRKLPVYSVERDDKCVSLTFDAAWGNV